MTSRIELAGRLADLESRAARLESLEASGSAGGGALALIEDKVLSSDSDDLSHTGIPSTYKGLFIVAWLENWNVNPALSTAFLDLNDTVNANDYSQYHRWISGGVGTQIQYTGGLVFADCYDSTLGAEADKKKTLTYIIIPAYAYTARHKSYCSFAASPSDDVPGSRQMLGHGSWRSTSAINKLQYYCTPVHGNQDKFRAGSWSKLFGLST